MFRSLIAAALMAAAAGSPFAQTAPAAQTSVPDSVPGYGVDDPAGRPPPSPEVIAARKAARQACAADVAKLCAGTQPGGGAVMQCVRQHRAEVSPGCGAALGALRDARRAARG